MEPQSGIILMKPPSHLQPIFFLQIQWLLGSCFDVRCPPLLAPCSESMCGVPPLLAPCSENMCGVPPPSIHFFVRCPPPCFSSVPWTLGSVLDFEQNWESGKFQLARWSQAQLVSSSVALLAELVYQDFVIYQDLVIFIFSYSFCFCYLLYSCNISLSCYLYDVKIMMLLELTIPWWTIRYISLCLSHK